MPGMGERAYVYAKASGIMGKSYIGKRIRGLEKASRLSELDRMVFPLSSRDLPGRELLRDLEKRITGRAIDSIIAILNGFSRIPEFFSLLVRSYEYADLKNAIIAFMEGEKTSPPFADLGIYQRVRFNAWPDLKAMLNGTEFEFLFDKKIFDIDKGDRISLETLLDRQYYSLLWKSLYSLPAKDRVASEKILSDEISLRNSGWALRLRTYYGMSPDNITPHLVDIYKKTKGGRKPGKISLADEAIRCLEYPLDNYNAFSSWHWKEFLNNPHGESGWKADPRYFQNAASRYLYGLARRYFRRNPFSLDTVFCFIKLKQFEENILTSSAEGLGIGLSSRETFSLLGVES